MPAGGGRHPRGIDRHPPQLPPTRRPRQLQHLRECVIDPTRVPSPERTQRPVVRDPLPQPKIAAPYPLGSAVPSAAHWSSPAHTHTAIPSASAPGDTVPHLRRYRLARTPADPCAPPLRAQKNTGARFPIRPSRWAAKDTLHPDGSAEIAACPFLPHFACPVI